MAQYVTPEVERELVDGGVGILPTLIVNPTDLRGSDEHVIEVINDGVEPLNAAIEASVNGQAPFTAIPDSAFEAIPVGESRIARVPSAWLWYRVRGAFTTTPGPVRYSVFVLKNFAHK